MFTNSESRRRTMFHEGRGWGAGPAGRGGSGEGEGQAGEADARGRAGRPERARKDAAKCRECPRWDGRRDWCPLRAAICSGHMPACMYGTILIRAKRLADRRRNNGK